MLNYNIILLGLPIKKYDDRFAVTIKICITFYYSFFIIHMFIIFHYFFLCNNTDLMY